MACTMIAVIKNRWEGQAGRLSAQFAEESDQALIKRLFLEDIRASLMAATRELEALALDTDAGGELAEAEAAPTS